MANTLQLTSEAHETLEAHLFQSDAEQVAFVFARAACAETDVHFDGVDYYLVPPEDLEYQSGFGVCLTDDALASLIKTAWDRRVALIEIHSHTVTYGTASFSPSDLRGFADFVPHIWWRLKGQPYCALVLAMRTFDALVWREDPRRPESLACLRVGDRQRRPTDRTIGLIRRNYGQGEI